MALPTSILCPVDFSSHSERALRHAVALAGAWHARLTVVTVNDALLVAAAAAAGHADTLRDQGEAALLDLLGRVPAHTTRVLPAIDVATGPAADEILLAAARAHADLIVMGTQGLGGTSKLMFGSTTERVIRTTRVPVLAVPDYTPECITVLGGVTRFAVGSVVAAVALDPLDGAVSNAAAAWAEACGATLVVAHVCQEAPAPAWWPFTGSPVPAESLEAARAQVQELAGALDVAPAPQVDVRRGAVPAAIAEITRDRAAGLLVVSRGGGEHRLGAVAYRIMCEADLPTLVVTGR